MKLKLKTDPKLPYHNIIGVAVHPATAGKKAGKLFLKYNVPFTNDDVLNIMHAAILSEDKLFKTTNSEAVKAYDCERVAGEMSAMQLSAKANECSLHHFSSEFEVQEEDLRIIVKLANNHDYYKDLLKKSSIRG